ncbi:MAG: dTMP kinase [Candidatus Abawacabacteria bacterium]|nr:dTMP kinase [Candidatus Abawacabacteria bacterium]
MKNTNKMTTKGKLIVFEGIDGSGKSTQIKKVKKYIEKEYGRKVVVSSWKSSPLVGDYLKHVEELDEQPTPLAMSIIIAADLSERVAKVILPALAAGKVVLCDRYSYTGIIRDLVVNGLDEAWLEDMYSFAPSPDMVLYFKVTDAISVQRVDSRMEAGVSKLAKKLRKKKGKISPKQMQRLIKKLKGSMSGGSMSGSMVDTLRSLKKGEKLYQINGDPLTAEIAQDQRLTLVNKLIATYEQMSKKKHFQVIDAMQPIKAVSKQIKSLLPSVL